MLHILLPFISVLSAIRLETALADIHMLVRCISNCAFHLSILFYHKFPCCTFTATVVRDQKVCDNSATFFCSRWSLLLLMQAGLGIITYRRDCRFPSLSHRCSLSIYKTFFLPHEWPVKQYYEFKPLCCLCVPNIQLYLIIPNHQVITYG